MSSAATRLLLGPVVVVLAVVPELVALFLQDNITTTRMRQKRECVDTNDHAVYRGLLRGRQHRVAQHLARTARRTTDGSEDEAAAGDAGNAAENEVFRGEQDAPVTRLHVRDGPLAALGLAEHARVPRLEPRQNLAVRLLKQQASSALTQRCRESEHTQE